MTRNVLNMLWLPLAFALCGVLITALPGCGPSLGELHSTHESHDVIRRDAARFQSLNDVTMAPGAGGEAVFEIRLKPGFYMPAHQEPNKKLLAAWLEGPQRTFVKLGEARWPEAKLLQLPAFPKPIQAYDGVVQVKLPLSAHASLQAMSHRLPFVLHYQLCTVRGCEVPETTVARVVVSIQPKP